MVSEWHQTQKLLHGTLPDGSWANERCYILGGGPSLKDFDLSATVGSRVIAVNARMKSARGQTLSPAVMIAFIVGTRTTDDSAATSG